MGFSLLEPRGMPRCTPDTHRSTSSRAVGRMVYPGWYREVGIPRVCIDQDIPRVCIDQDIPRVVERYIPRVVPWYIPRVVPWCIPRVVPWCIPRVVPWWDTQGGTIEGYPGWYHRGIPRLCPLYTQVMPIIHPGYAHILPNSSKEWPLFSRF